MEEEKKKVKKKMKGSSSSSGMKKNKGLLGVSTSSDDDSHELKSMKLIKLPPSVAQDLQQQPNPKLIVSIDPLNPDINPQSKVLGMQEFNADPGSSEDPPIVRREWGGPYMAGAGSHNPNLIPHHRKQNFNQNPFWISSVTVENSGNVYSLEHKDVVTPTCVFSETKQGSVSVEGEVTEKLGMMPQFENLEESGKRIRERTKQSMDKKRQTKVIRDRGEEMKRKLKKSDSQESSSKVLFRGDPRAVFILTKKLPCSKTFLHSQKIENRNFDYMWTIGGWMDMFLRLPNLDDSNISCNPTGPHMICISAPHFASHLKDSELHLCGYVLLLEAILLVPDLTWILLFPSIIDRTHLRGVNSSLQI
ncbi:Transcription initiation factor IIF [Macleaya cordata]|uniref:Transcription initiation factor IIF n=1 Tax=Macleaya cordata TaxID=56857 RepID=A0A200R5W2_MACCD|nr:Transcription initiation factor IIF [Macleaya cordata]